MKTRKISILLALVLPLVLLSGCYESKYPITGAKEPVKTELIGNFIGENFPEMKVIPISDTDYFILFSNKEGDTTMGKAYSLPIGNSNIMVFQEMSSEKNNYWFFKYNFSKIGNTYALTAQSVSEKFINRAPPKSQGELTDIITKNIDNEEMFDTPQTFLKLANTDVKIGLYIPDED